MLNKFFFISTFLFFHILLDAQVITGPTIVCVGESFNYAIETSLGQTTSWSATNGTANQNGNILFQVAGPGQVAATICNDGGIDCNDYFLSIECIDLTVPIMYASNQLNVEDKRECVTCGDDLKSAGEDLFFAHCEFAEVEYSVEDIEGASYEWAVFGDLSSPFSNTNSINVNWGEAGQGQVVCTIDLGNGCETEIVYCIDIIEKPEAAYETLPAASNNFVEVCLGQEVVFTNLEIPVETVLWEFGDGFSDNNNQTTHAYLAAGTYKVTLTVTNECACSDESVFEVLVNETYAPNIEPTYTECPEVDETYVYAVTNTLDCPENATYSWSVTGGTIVQSDPYSPTVSIHWGAPASGYGVVTVSVNDCGDEVCKLPASIIIYLINENIEISGEEVLCPNEAALYSIPALPGSDYVWTLDGSPSGITAVNGEFSNTVLVQCGTVGVCTLQVVTNNFTLDECPRDLTKQFYITVLPEMNIFGPAQYCEGGTPTYGISNVLQGMANWTISNGPASVNPFFGEVPTSENFIPWSFLPPNTYSIQIESSAYCEDGLHYFEVIENAPTPLIDEFDAVCLDGTGTYTAAAENGYYLRWEVSGGVIENTTETTSIGNQIIVDWDASGNYLLTLSQHAIEQPDCPSETVSIDVPIIPTGQFSIEGAEFVQGDCELVYSINPSGGEDLEWTIDPPHLATIVSGQNTGEIILNVHLPTDGSNGFNIIASGSLCGQSQTTSYQVIYKRLFKAPIIGPVTTCQGSGLVFQTFNVNFPESITAYTWNFGNGTVISGQNSGYQGPFNTGAYDIPGLQTVTLSLTYEDFDGCYQTVTTTKTIDVKPLPVAYVTSPTNFLICNQNPEAVDMYASQQNLPNGALSLTYEWTHPDGSTTLGPSLLGLWDPGNYTLTVTADYGNGIECTQTVTETITEDDCGEPCTVYEIKVTKNCNNFEFQLVGNGIFSLVNWDFGDDSFSLGQFPFTTQFHTYDHAGYYTVSCEIINLVCFATTTITVSLVPEFLTEITCDENADNDYRIHFYDYSNFLPGYSPNTYSFYEEGENEFFSTSQSNSSVSIEDTPLEPGNVDVCMFVVSPLDGAKCEFCQEVTIPEPVNANFSVEDEVCEGTVLNFVNNSTGNSSNLWDFGDNSGSQLSSPEKFYVDFVGTPTVTLTVSDNYGCSSSTSQEINIYENTIAGTITILGPLPVCASEGVILQASANTSNPLLVYTWFLEGDSNPIGTGAQITVFEPGVYVLDISDGVDCLLSLETNYINLVPEPTPSIQGIDNPCEGETMFLSTNYPNIPGEMLVAWQITSPSGTLIPSNSFVLEESGTYEVCVSVTDEVTNCTGSICTEFTPHPNPSVIINSEDLCIPTVLEADVICNDEPCDLIWNNDNSNEEQIINYGGTYSVTVTNANGCTASAEQTVEDPPSFENLMVGSYVFCKEDNPSNGPIIWEIPPVQGYKYLWKDEEGNVIHGGTYPDNPFAHIIDFNQNQFGTGIYYLTIITPNDCEYTSPAIILDIVEECEEEECQLKVEDYEVNCIGNDGTNDLYQLTVTLLNNGSHLVGLDAWSENPNVEVSEISPTILASGETQEYVLQVSAPSSQDVVKVYFSAWNAVLDQFCMVDLKFGAPDCCGDVNIYAKIESCFDILPGLNLYFGNMVIQNPFETTLSIQMLTPGFPMSPLSATVPPNGEVSLPFGAVAGVSTQTVQFVGSVLGSNITCTWEVDIDFPPCNSFTSIDDCKNLEVLDYVSKNIGKNTTKTKEYAIELNIKNLSDFDVATLMVAEKQRGNLITNLKMDLKKDYISFNLIDQEPFEQEFCFDLFGISEEGKTACEFLFCIDADKEKRKEDSEISSSIEANQVILNSFKLFPNPASEILHLNWKTEYDEGDFEFELLAINGTLISKEKHALNGRHLSLNIHHLQDGLYILRIRHKGIPIHHERFVKAAK